MTNSGLLWIAAAVCLFAVSAANAADSAPRERGAMLMQLDKDADGRISRAEADAGGAKRLVERFDSLDGKQDGFLTREEMQAAMQQRKGERRREMRERMREVDANGDGQVSLDEAQAKAPRLAERFGEIDADKNGYLSREELHAARPQRKPQG